MTSERVSDIFDPTAWREVQGFDDLTDITYHRAVEGGRDVGTVVPNVGNPLG